MLQPYNRYRLLFCGLLTSPRRVLVGGCDAIVCPDYMLRPKKLLYLHQSCS